MGASDTKTYWNVSQANVFITYSRQNRSFAKDLYRRLDAESFKLWRDVHDIEAGADDWWEAIKEGIEQCNTLILCMSMPALKSPVVSDEWFYARQLGKRVIPVVADDIWGHPDVVSGEFTIPNWMNRRNWIDYRDGQPEADAAWQNLIRTLRSPHTPKRFINMVEELPPRFVRRPHDIDRAIRSLVDDKNDAIAMTTALKGAGGYGKTTLVKAIARDVRVQGAFDDGILWVTLGEELLRKQVDVLRNTLIAMVQELIDALTDRRPVIETLEMAGIKLKEAIGESYILLVIDDVWDEAHLKPFLVKGPHSACLITTRNIGALGRSEMVKHDVDKMLPAEAVELLSAGFAPEEAEPLKAEFTAFARDLREYPLLLALANSAIANWKDDLNIPLSEALQLARETFTEQGILGFDDEDTQDRTRAVDRTLAVSLSQLKPDEKRRYLELAIFREDASIPLTTLERYWGMSKVQALQFCSKLYRKTALLQSMEGGAIRIHDVFRDYLIRQHTAEEQRALQARLIDAYGDLTALPDAYAWRNIAYHLSEAGKLDTLHELLLDYRFLQAKLDATDVNALIADCDYLAGDEAIRLLKSALHMSMHVLKEDTTALAHQLVGRLILQRRKHDEIRLLTDKIAKTVPGIYPSNLDCPRAVLDQAGGVLLATLMGHSEAVNGGLALRNRQLLSWAEDGTLRLWDTNGAALETLVGHAESVKSALELADGRLLSWSGHPNRLAEGTMRLWSPDGVALGMLIGHTKAVVGALELIDRRLLSWSYDGTLRLWDEIGTPMTILEGHTATVSGAILLSDERILSWSWDGTLRLWTNHGKLQSLLEGHSGRVNGALELSDSRLLSWGTDGMRLWSNEGQLLAVLTDTVDRTMHLENGGYIPFLLTAVNGAVELEDGRLLSCVNLH